jgi:hypothetical protein
MNKLSELVIAGLVIFLVGTLFLVIYQADTMNKGRLSMEWQQSHPPANQR